MFDVDASTPRVEQETDARPEAMEIDGTFVVD